jgi:hypothetical protein
VPADEGSVALETLQANGIRAVQIGTVEPGSGQVRLA